ncbi:M24 family metallopeptidase [Candidatus Daviesbacteria bacterium]|nr:M24 family metallopeptidase [Candidatus Daviesbacteria bacterium]
MRKSGGIAAKALKKAIETISVGVSGVEVDEVVKREIYKLGGDLSYKTVPGYKYATCITVNEQVVHGIPTDRKFESGDLVSVDLAVMYKGWHTDCAWSVLVREQGTGNPPKARFEESKTRRARLAKGGRVQEEEKKKFLKTGEEALWDGIKQAVTGNRVGDISNAIQTKVEGAGYQVVRSLVGHGVGRSLHEDPEIPGFGEKGKGPVLKDGMTLAIEVIYAQGKSDVVLESDGWTFKTADNSWGGLFETSVIVGGKPEVLTGPNPTMG